MVELSAFLIKFVLYVCNFKGCSSSPAAKANKPIDLQWFPDKIGNFHRVAEPSSSSDGVNCRYQNDLGKVVDYSFYDDRNTSGDFYARNGESLLEAPGILLYFTTQDRLHLTIFDSGKSATVEAYGPATMSDWVNVFPYE